MAVLYATEEKSRGGGERGSIERGESWECSETMPEAELAGAESSNGSGKTKITEATAALSGLWQQDMLQAVMLAMSCPQSM